MKAKVVAGAIIAIIGIGLIAFTVSQSQAQTNVASPNLAQFVALMQYIRSEPTPADVHPNSVSELAVVNSWLSDIYINGFITPFTRETSEQMKARLQSVPEEDRFIAVMVESYRHASSPLLLDILHSLLARYYVDILTTSNLSDAPDFLERADIQSLADAFDSADYAIPAPSNTGSPQPTPISTATQPTPTSTMPSLALRYDPAGQDRDCDDFSNWQEAQAFFLATQNDSHGLDPDGNGIACEELSGAPQPQQIVVTPTPTPSPTFPNSINAGTYRVGTEIATGLYRGIVPDTRYSSCEWERWRKNGDWSYVASEFYYIEDGYQFYFRVLATDYELKTDCQLTRVTDFTRPPTSELPDTIGPGTYLVGVDIKPGIYEGVVPTGDYSSCRWSRHMDFTEHYTSFEIIDSGYHSDDGEVFAVLVAPRDYGFRTSCLLTLVQ